MITELLAVVTLIVSQVRAMCLAASVAIQLLSTSDALEIHVLELTTVSQMPAMVEHAVMQVESHILTSALGNHAPMECNAFQCTAIKEAVPLIRRTAILQARTCSALGSSAVGQPNAGLNSA